MTRFLVLSSAILLSTLSAGLFAVSSAHAVSSYDDIIHPINQILLNDNSTNGNTKDITQDWSAYISDKTYDNQQSYISDEERQSFKNALTTGDWAVEVVDPKTSGGYYYAQVIWSESKNGYIDWQQDRAVIKSTTQDLHLASIEYYGGSIYVTGLTNTISQPTGVQIGSNTSNYKDFYRIFLSTFSVTYPQGYAGKSIPQTAGKTVIAPDFTYEYTGNEIKATDHNKTLPDFTPDEGYRSEGWEVSWILYECKNGTYDDNTRVCHGDPAIVQDSLKFQKQNQEYSFTVPDHKQYKLEAQYAIKQCYRYPSYPSTPDYCAYFPLNGDNGYFKDYEFQTRDVILDINGGSGSGDTLNLQCDASGSCKPAPVNCSLEPGFFQKLSCQIQQQMKIGFINPIITTFVSMYQKMTVTSGQCSQLLPDSPQIYGQTLPFSQLSTKVCQWSDSIRGNAAFAWVTIMVNLLFSLMIFIGIKNLINRITDHKDNEVIQS